MIVAFAVLTGSALIGLLWATEPGLPLPTRVAFAVLVAIGLSWSAFGAWAVTRRTPLFAQDRVVAGRLGVGAWLVFTVGVLTITPDPLPLGIAVALGVPAVVNLWAARRARAALLRRKAMLR